jgi:hypothetical protein
MIVVMVLVVVVVMVVAISGYSQRKFRPFPEAPKSLYSSSLVLPIASGQACP